MDLLAHIWLPAIVLGIAGTARLTRIMRANLLDELKVYLSARQIQPGVAEWLRERDLIQSKLKQEIVNLKFGVERGDQIEMQRDPVVQRAVQSLSAPLR